jgi:glycosyltransferase involved in cell wall biosynthesis
MRLLICTQAVDENDPVLGFFCRWIVEFAARCEHIHVICLREGKYSLPGNVSVHSLGKESGASRIKYLARFFRYSFALRRGYDTVFVHMNEEYVLLGGLVWRLLGKKIALWRNHKMGSWRTRIALKLSSVVFHTSPQAFVAHSAKAVEMPIGIDTDLFSPGAGPVAGSILFLGRLDAVKRPELFLGAMREIAETHPDARADIYGDPTPGREAFAEELKRKFSGLSNVSFHGAVANDLTPALYRSHAIYVNTTPSGSFDKTIGEALSSGALVIAANAAVAPVLGEFFSDTEDPERLASVMSRALDMGLSERISFAGKAREYVVMHHSLRLLADRVFDSLR